MVCPALRKESDNEATSDQEPLKIRTEYFSDVGA
jgi:hypothetical protein